MSMMRHSVTTAMSRLPLALSLEVVRPTAIGFLDKLPPVAARSTRLFTTSSSNNTAANKKNNANYTTGATDAAATPRPKEEEIIAQEEYSDAFDESDALEKGKKTRVVPGTKKNQQQQLNQLRRYRPLFPLTRTLRGFDDLLFGPRGDPFAPFFSHHYYNSPFGFGAGHVLAPTAVESGNPLWHIMPVLKRFPMLDSSEKDFFDEGLFLHEDEDENENEDRMMTTLLRSSPGYEIKETKDGFYEIAVDIPKGVKASDLKVELEQDGTVLHLQGERKVVGKGGMTRRHYRFDKRFTIGSNVDTEKLSANFSPSNGVLVLKAPMLEPVLEEEPKTRTIAITTDEHQEEEN